MVKCYRCKSRITTHLWLKNGNAYCSPACERGAKSLFEKTYKALKKK